MKIPDFADWTLSKFGAHNWDPQYFDTAKVGLRWMTVGGITTVASALGIELGIKEAYGAAGVGALEYYVGAHALGKAVFVEFLGSDSHS